MKIAFYLNNLWGISATARIAYMLALQFKKLNKEVIFIVNKEPVEIGQEFPIYILKTRGDFKRAKEIGKLLEKENVDFCIGIMRPQSVVLGLARIFYPNLKAKLIGSIHSTDNHLKYNKFYQIPYRYLVKFLIEKLDGFVAVSKAVKQDLKDAFFIKEDFMKVIYNPIDIEMIQNKAKEKIPEEEKYIFENPVIIKVARLEKEKGLHHLINIFNLVNKKLPETRLVLVGDGSLRKDLEKQVKDLKLEDKVYFLGWKENPFPYVKNSKIFAMTSIFEGLPMVILEAMSLGVIPMAFKTRGGHIEVLENCCPLIKYPNEEEYANEIVKLLKDKNYYNSIKEKVSKRIKDFSADKIAKEYLAYMESLS